MVEFATSLLSHSSFHRTVGMTLGEKKTEWSGEREFKSRCSDHGRDIDNKTKWASEPSKNKTPDLSDTM